MINILIIDYKNIFGMEFISNYLIKYYFLKYLFQNINKNKLFYFYFDVYFKNYINFFFNKMRTLNFFKIIFIKIYKL